MVGIKEDTGKPRWSLLPLGPLRAAIRVLEFGAKKYGYQNWQQLEQPRVRLYNASMRHLTSWWDGSPIDPDTGESHLAHAMCCLLFLLWFEMKGECNENDPVREK